MGTDWFVAATRLLVALGYTYVSWSLIKSFLAERRVPTQFVERMLLFVAATYSAWAILEWHAVFLAPTIRKNVGFWTTARALHVPMLLVGHFFAQLANRYRVARIATKKISETS